jgi:hypothetical protein
LLWGWESWRATGAGHEHAAPHRILSVKLWCCGCGVMMCGLPLTHRFSIVPEYCDLGCVWCCRSKCRPLCLWWFVMLCDGRHWGRDPCF